MATSNYFNNFNSRPEQLLYEDLIGEVVKIYGIDAYYIPRESDSEIDLLFGDDPTKKFSAAYPMEVYINNVDGFDGGELFSKFGLEVRKEVSFILPHRAYKKVIPIADYPRPREGDLLWLKNFQSLFEIKFVEEEHFFFTFGKNNFYGFKLNCEFFRFNNDNMETGWTEVDDMQTLNASSYRFSMQSGGTLTYETNEIVYQGNSYANATATAEVTAWDKPTLKLDLRSIVGEFAVNTVIRGVTTNAAYTMLSVDEMDNVSDLIDNNRQIETEASSIIDFSESNPFGEL